MNRVKNVIQCFFNLAKTSYSKKHMTKLKHAEGSVTVDPKLILGEMRHFHQQLYSSQGHSTPAVLSNFLKLASLPKLGSLSKASVRVWLHEEECLFVLKSFQRNTTPGTDVFLSEVLSLFLEWDLQPPTFFLTLSIMGRFLGELSISQDKESFLWFHKRISSTSWKLAAYLSLQKHRLQTYNEMYRKTDRKRSSPSHRNRRDQAGYIKGRFKGENIHLFSDIIKQNGKEEGMILFLDSEKSLDSLEWEYLFQVLDATNFGPNIFRQLDPYILS